MRRHDQQIEIEDEARIAARLREAFVAWREHGRSRTLAAFAALLGRPEPELRDVLLGLLAAPDALVFALRSHGVSASELLEGAMFTTEALRRLG